jgi:Protein of unknown function (DUF2637)
MRQLAAAHGDTGWHAHAFPLSVDGVEIVASLVLLANRRASRTSGWLPWAALTIGTAASLAANIATADTGAISRVIAGWPAVALLIAVKLLPACWNTARPPMTRPAPGRMNLPGRPVPRSRQPTVPVAPVPRPRVPDPQPGRPAACIPGSSPATSRHWSRPPEPCRTNCTGTAARSPATPSPPACAPPVTPSATPASPRCWPPSGQNQHRRARRRVDVAPGHPPDWRPGARDCPHQPKPVPQGRPRPPPLKRAASGRQTALGGHQVTGPGRRCNLNCSCPARRHACPCINLGGALRTSLAAASLKPRPRSGARRGTTATAVAA